MSDTPTTAEEVIAQAIVATVEARRRGRSHLTAEFEAGAIVAALRSSPEALADLNGGEWVPAMMRSPEFTDPVTGTVALEADIPVAIAADLWTFESGPEFTTGARPLFVFVPKGATDGTD